MPARKLSTSEAEQLRAFERQGHDALAATYQEFFAPVTAIAIAPLLDAVGLRPGTHLLDVAAGPGKLAAAAARRGAQAVGVDLSPRMVELARRLHPGIDFREAEVEHLPFADRTFDAVVCGFGLEVLLKNRSFELSQIKRYVGPKPVTDVRNVRYG